MAGEDVQTAVDRLHAYLDEQVRAIDRALPKIRKRAKPKPVHAARIAARRLSAALDAFEPVLHAKPRKRLKRYAKRVRRALGPLRDTDAMGDTLATARPTARVRSDVGRVLKRSRKKAVKRAVRSLPDRDRDSLREDLAKAFVDLTSAAAVACLREAAYAAVDAISRVVEAKESASDRGLHAARIAAKHLRYAIEIGHVMGLPLPAGLRGKAEAIQSRLGAWHDTAVLAAYILKHADKIHVIDAPTERVSELVRFAGRLTARATRTDAAFRRGWQRTGTTLARALRAVLPASKRVNRSRTDRDPSG